MDIECFKVGQLQTNCYILFTGDESAVIDPGGNCDKIIGKLSGINTKLKYIIITHYHEDHASCAVSVQKAIGGEILVHEADINFLDFIPNRSFHSNDIVKLDEEELRVYSTPGHTPGSICLLGENFIFTGDTLFKDGCGRTDLAGGSDSDMAKSLAYLQTVIKPGMTVYPGHGEIFKA